MHTQNCAEIVEAYQNVEQLPRNGIYIYDHGYASFGLAYLHHRYGSDYVIRMPLDEATIVKNFVKSGATDQIITVKLHVGRAYRKLKELGLTLKLHTEFTVRLVRVELDDDEVEVLMTSRTDRERYPTADFKGLYGKRWGVETAIFTLSLFCS